jgi:hypothetical protein
MQTKNFRKGLVIGIILLFIGLAFIPSFNAVSISKTFDDTTPPFIDLYYEYWRIAPNDWEFLFTAECNDTESGMNKVEFDIDGELMETDYSEPYEYQRKWSQLKGHRELTATAYDNAGNNASEYFDLRSRSLDIKSNENCIECDSNGRTYLAEKLFNRLEKNDVLSNVINLNNLYDRPVCNILLNLMEYYYNLAWYFLNLAYAYPQNSFLYKFYLLTSESIFQMVIYSYAIGLIVDCWDPYPY